MNREIRFRGWNGVKMLFYNHYFTLHYQTVLCFEEEESHSYVDESDVDFPTRVTLMQFTGLRDKNGKEIYEGDVLKGGSARQSPVYWKDDGFVLVDNQKHVYCLAPQVDCCEIIGNIYENPKLSK